MIDYDGKNPKVIDFTELLPEEMIKEEYIEVYKKEVDAIWRQLVRLNSNIFILEKLLHYYPHLNIFLPEEDIHFWDLIQSSLIESSVMIIWNIYFDKNKECFKILNLKEKTENLYIENNYKDAMKILLENSSYKQIDKALKKRIRILRNNIVAHHNYDINVELDKKKIEERIVFQKELETFKNVLNKLFDMLCFGRQKSKLITQYLIRENGSEKLSDIEKVLESIIKNSELLNMPEEQKDSWAYYRKNPNNLKKGQLSVINKYRREFGLHEV